jgi:predicted acetyltransferase
VRRRGHARRILAALLAWLRESGVEVVELSASPDGAPLYRAFGFSETTHPLMRLYREPAPVRPPTETLDLEVAIRPGL